MALQMKKPEVESEKLAQNSVPSGDLNVKKRRKAKNKYKELNLLQKKNKQNSNEEPTEIPKDPSEHVKRCLKKGYVPIGNKINVKKDKSQKSNSTTKLNGQEVTPLKSMNLKRKFSKAVDPEDVQSACGQPAKKRKLSDKQLGNKTKKSKNSKVEESQTPSTNANNSVKNSGNKLKKCLQKNLKKKEENDKPRKEKDARVENKSLNLKEQMMERLVSARFRFINERLYKSTGEDAVEMFQEDEESFNVYHEGFSNQVAKWPVNPVDLMVEYIEKKPNNVVVADFGCGDAKIARMLEKKTVHSFDLVALNEFVTVANISKVPLPSKSLDIVVFCLSLMGTNLVSYLCEASRVLKQNGILLIAEVSSRFGKVGGFIRKLKKLGFSLVEKNNTNEMFIWFEFKKTDKPPSEEKLPKIELTPCVYKKR